jgi:glycolate oxidase FAD binding subunit
MQTEYPGTPEELAGALASAAGVHKSIRLGGAFTKNAMAGPLPDADVVISTSRLKRIVKYEPRDLTISVEAGLPFAELSRTLAEHRQMVPLDPPFFAEATVGGVVAANTSGPRRRLYGSVRDVVIGMKFATLEGKLIQSGGMVVKNVAGLDMGKLMIGSFGTLAAVAIVNFKLAPMPPASCTFLLRFSSLEQAVATRDRILQNVLQPATLDLLNPQAASRIGQEGYCLLLQAGGNAAVLERYARELKGAEVLNGPAEEALWTAVREFTPAYLASHPDGAVLRVSTTLRGVQDVMTSSQGPVVARAGNGVLYAYFPRADGANLNGFKGVIEFAPEALKRSLPLWPSVGSDFEMMKRVKNMFDPLHLLNRGRLYGRI